MDTVNQGKGGDPQKPWFVQLTTGGGTAPVVVTQEALSTTGGNAGINLALAPATATALVTSANATRRNISIQNLGPNPIIVGFTNDVASLQANGQQVPAGASAHVDSIDPGLVVYGLATVADQAGAANTRVSETGGTVGTVGIIAKGFVALPGGNPNFVVVPYAATAATTEVFVTVRTPGGAPGSISVDPADYVNGVSFTIRSSSPIDTSTINYAVT